MWLLPASLVDQLLLVYVAHFMLNSWTVMTAWGIIKLEQASLGTLRGVNCLASVFGCSLYYFFVRRVADTCTIDHTAAPSYISGSTYTNRGEETTVRVTLGPGKASESKTKAYPGPSCCSFTTLHVRLLFEENNLSCARTLLLATLSGFQSPAADSGFVLSS